MWMQVKLNFPWYVQFTLVSKINFKETFLTTVRNKLQFNIAVLCLVEIQGDQTTMICSK